MKKLFMLGVAWLVLVGAAGAAEEIAFVNLERLFNDFYKTQLAKSKVEGQQDEIQAERDGMAEEMKQISEEVDLLRKEARDLSLSQDVRDQKRILFEERLLELRDKQTEIDEFVERRSKQVQTQVVRMSQTIMDEIRQTIIEYARKEGFHAVIDSSKRNQTAVGVFLYVRPDKDISQAILTELNSKRPDVMEVEDDQSDDSSDVENGEAEENESQI